MTTPTLTTGGLQSTDGGNQQITVAGMTAWLESVNGFRAANAGKKQLFGAKYEDVVRTSRREVD